MGDASLTCIECGEAHPPDVPRWRCGCGGPLEVEWSGMFARESLAGRPAGLWRYREAIPIADDARVVSMGEGMTPLAPVPFAGMEILCKLDFLLPTGSFKDRGAAALITKIKEWGIEKILADSSGNAAAAIAAYAARAGVACDIYVPASTSAAKRAQIAAYGAVLHEVPGPREAASAAAAAAAGERFYASHFWNDWFNHGTKTWAFEAWEQLGFRAPDAVVVPAGHGSTLIGAHRGFSELLRAGLIERLPRIFAAQAANCAPMARTWEENLEAPPALRAKPTLAEGISISRPIRWRRMLAAVRESGGGFLAVEDARLPPVLRAFAREGILMEPTSAVAFAAAALLAEAGKIRASETVVVPATGHGLKAADRIEGWMSA